VPISVASVPGVGLSALAIALSETAAWLLWERRTALGLPVLPVLPVLIAIPLVVVVGNRAVFTSYGVAAFNCKIDGG
jgi:hypothetical protein